MVKNKVVLKERDVWSNLANFIEEMVAKYAEAMDLVLASGEINHSETGENSQFQSDRKSQYTSFSFL